MNFDEVNWVREYLRKEGREEPRLAVVVGTDYAVQRDRRGCLENWASTTGHSEAEVEQWRATDVVLTLRAQAHPPKPQPHERPLSPTRLK